MRKPAFALLVVFICSIIYPGAFFNADQALTKAEIDRILFQFPAENSSDADILAKQVLELGEEGLLSLFSRLAPSRVVTVASAQYAVNGTVHFVGKSGSEKDRRMLVNAMSKALKKLQDGEARTFLIEQLQAFGGDRAVKPLARLLDHSTLGESSVRALSAIGTEKAKKALLKGLDKAVGMRRIAVINALGRLAYDPAADRILAWADSNDKDLRWAARSALAYIGNPKTERKLSKMEISASWIDRMRAADLYLVFARRLADRGYRARAAAIFRKIISSYAYPGESQIAASALTHLVELLGEDAFDDVLSTVDSPIKSLRGTALQSARFFPSKDATEKLIAKMRAADMGIQKDFLHMLGGRGDPEALPVVLDLLRSDDVGIRCAAIPAAVNLGGTAALPEIAALFPSGQTEQEAAVLKSVLSVLPRKAAIAAAANGFATAAAPVKVVLLEYLAEAGAREHAGLAFSSIEGQQPDLKKAALSGLENLVSTWDLPVLFIWLSKLDKAGDRIYIQNAIISAATQFEDPLKRSDVILEALGSVEGQTKIDLMRTLARIGGEKALRTIQMELENPNESIRTAALHTLVRWEDPAAVDLLSNFYLEPIYPNQNYLILQGCLRLLETSDLDFENKFSLISQFFEKAQTLEEKSLIISGLREIRTIDSQRLLGKMLTEPDLRERSAWAILNITLPNLGDDGLSGEEAAATLKQAAEFIIDDYQQERIAQYLSEISPEKDFVPLFNGKDLSGWVGNLEGCGVESGGLIIYPEKEGGNIYTEAQYSDFILRFEFKLTSGANNGLGIRAPLQGDAAYVGMEIQILDDSALQYNDLKPYQYHGSIYGLVPAKRGALKPVGEWNEEEVIVKGRMITVILNGTTIVDANIDHAADPQPMDGRDHPGIKRERGHIGFLGHGTRVEFRKIRIKDLKKVE